MLNEKELSMAKELASELVIVQKKKTKESITRSLNKVKKMILNWFENVKNIVKRIWESVKSIEVMEHEMKIHDNKWRIPRSDLRSSQVKMPSINMPKIRSSI